MNRDDATPCPHPFATLRSSLSQNGRGKILPHFGGDARRAEGGMNEKSPNKSWGLLIPTKHWHTLFCEKHLRTQNTCATLVLAIKDDKIIKTIAPCAVPSADVSRKRR